jgi:hypothetical protein
MNQEEDIIYGLVAWKKHKWRSGYTRYGDIKIDGRQAPDIKLSWRKGFDEKILTFTQGKKPQGGVEEISYKERKSFRREDGGVAEWKITGIVTIEEKPEIPGKRETITFQFREKDNHYFGKGYTLEFWRELIMGKEKTPTPTPTPTPTIWDQSPNAWMQDVRFSNPDDKPIPYSGGKRRKTRKQRKSRKGGKKSRKQRKSRKSSKKSHKRRTRKRRTR